MSKLDAAERKDLPKSDFGEPGKRAYPMPDDSHAANAKGRAKEALRKGHISESAYSKIVSKADKKLGEKPGAYGKDTFEVGHLQSKDSGQSESKGNPNGNSQPAEKFAELQGKKPADDGANPRKEPLAVASNDSAEQRGDMSDGADGASKDRFWPGSSAARSDRRW